VAPGRGPAKGAPNAGRPSNADRDEAAALLADPKHLAAVRKALRDPTNRNFAGLTKMLWDRKFGRQATPVAVRGKATLRIVVARETR
jgi:hypothetical protein